MTDQTKTDLDAFEGEGSDGGFTHFGELKIYLNRVDCVGGASYVIPGVQKSTRNADGSWTEPTGDFVWKGKRKDADNRTAHIVMGITKQKQDGEKYTFYRDLLNNEDAFKEKVRPALKEVLGEAVQSKLNGPAFFAQVKEINTGKTWLNDAGETMYNKCFVLEKVFATPQEMVAASDKFFDQFEKKNDNLPDGMTPGGWEILKETFREQLNKGITPEKLVETFGENAQRFLDELSK